MDPPSVLLYTFKCPCPSCAGRIAQFAAERPHVRLEVAFEFDHIPSVYAKFRPRGDSDASSLAMMRSAGVQCLKFRPEGVRPRKAAS